MFYQKTLQSERRSCLSLTEELQECLRDAQIQEGYAVISLADVSCSLAITSFWDPRGLEDLLDEIDRNFPARVMTHHQESVYDAAARIKTSCLGQTATLLIKDGKYLLGSSQGVVLVEHDGPRQRKWNLLLRESPLYLEKIEIRTTFMGMHDLSPDVRKIVERSGIKEGVCHISQLHSTAGILLCSSDVLAQKELMADIERIIPTRGDFRHRETASDAAGHVKTAFTDSQLSLIVSAGKPVLAPSQAVVFAEYDGPRPRSCYVAVLRKGE